MKIQWKDVSSYSHKEKHDEPKTWEYKGTVVRLVVTRHIDYPGRWVMLDSWMGSKTAPRLLDNTDIERAKKEAINIIYDIIDQCTHEFHYERIP